MRGRMVSVHCRIYFGFVIASVDAVLGCVNMLTTDCTDKSKQHFMSENCISLYNIRAIFLTGAITERKRKMVQKILHEPQLDTILMVEKTIREARSYPTKRELLKCLPRQIQYQTFNRILEYLESSNKIVFDGRKIVWVFADNPKLKELLENSEKLR
jgi:hypothetical protein